MLTIGRSTGKRNRDCHRDAPELEWRTAILRWSAPCFLISLRYLFISVEKAVFKLAESFAWSNPVLTEEYISNSVWSLGSRGGAILHRV